MKSKIAFLIAITLLMSLACQFLTPSPTDESVAPTQPQEAITQPTNSVSIAEITDGHGIPMMLVSAGEFTMGIENPFSLNPVHQVYLDEYYIDKYEVTNARYAECVNAGVCNLPHRSYSETRENYYGNPEFDNYPVLAVDYEPAKIYCNWRGAQLPTEAQWEKAARGTDQRRYPWGKQSGDDTLANYDNNQGDTTAVGSYPGGASPYGVLDMAGNVWEWVADWYSIDYLPNSPYSNPTGSESGTMPVVRGGAWDSNWSDIEMFNRRVNIANPYRTVGFRCARTP